MLLNKFNPRSFLRFLRVFGIPFILWNLFSCSKTANSHQNKSYLGVTHVAYGVPPISVSLGGAPLFSLPLAFGQTTGIPGNPYDTITTGIQYLTIDTGTQSLIRGNSAFQQGSRYSLFVYDSLDPRSVGVIVFQDFQGDNIGTYYRFLNFTPGYSLGLYLTNAIDTFTINPVEYLGYNPQPSAYAFNTLYYRTGRYGVRVFYDSANYNIDSSNVRQLTDSLELDSTKVYNIYLQGFYQSSSGPDSLSLRSVRLN